MKRLGVAKQLSRYYTYTICSSSKRCDPPRHFHKYNATSATVEELSSLSPTINNPRKHQQFIRVEVSRPLLVSTRNATTSSRHITTNNSTPENGDYCYSMALELIKKSETIAREMEEKKSAEQYEAMRRATGATDDGVVQTTTASRRAGVAVVKTIARQTRDNMSSSAKTTDDNVVDDARYWLEKAAFEHHHPSALIRLGNAILDESRTPPSQKSNGPVHHHPRRRPTAEESTLASLPPARRAARLYESAGRCGSPEGWYNLGHLLWNGRGEDLPSCRRSSLDAFENAIAGGDTDALYFVGATLLSTDETNEEERRRKTRRRGLDLVTTAARRNHPGALHYLALFHLNGDDELSIPRHPGAFRDYLDRACRAGCPSALHLRGRCHYDGTEGFPRNRRGALDDFVAAGEAGSAAGWVSAGAVWYEGGEGVERERRRAFECYQRGAEGGSLEGWRNVVSCYMLGEGVPRCERTARYIANMMLKDDDEEGGGEKTDDGR